jgi:hypothetical protein
MSAQQRVCYVPLALLWCLVESLCVARLSLAQERISCRYQDERGVIHEVSDPARIPEALRAQAQCYTREAPSTQQPAGEYLAAAAEVKLDGNLRKVRLSSLVGPIELRWPRAVEQLFGRTPERAMVEAARALARALRSGGFPNALQTFSTEWQVVFLDENLPETQIPRSLITNCHPAWMTPVAQLYIVAQRVAAGCGSAPRRSATVADAELAHILLHEMGHVIEYQLLQGRQSAHSAQDRMRAEGFASWFEQYASDYSASIPRGSVRRQQLALAREAIRQSPEQFVFSGSAQDYARAALFFMAIVERRGVRGLVQVYEQIGKEQLPFFEAVHAALGWNQARLEKEVQALLEAV